LTRVGGIMPYTIRYFRAGKAQGTTPWDGPLDMMQKIAADGLICHGMDRADIADEEGSIMWSSCEDPPHMVTSTAKPGVPLWRWLRSRTT